MICGLVASRLFHVADQWSLYSLHPEQILAVANGGASVVGAIVGGVVGGVAAISLRRLPVAATVDRGIAGLPLGMAIGRVGDVINGEHWATACAGLPWCVRYTNPATLGQSDYVHPAVAYELVLDLVILAGLIVLERRWTARGLRGGVAFAFLLAYGVVRLGLASVRLDPLWLFGVSQAVATSLLFVLIGAAGLVWRARTAAPYSD